MSEASDIHDVLQKLCLDIDTGKVQKLYVMWEKDGEYYDEVMGFPLTELVGALETAKHMQLQEYVQKTLRGLKVEDMTLEEKVELLYNTVSQQPGNTAKRWSDLTDQERKNILDAIRKDL